MCTCFLFSAPAPEEHKPPSETSHTGGVSKAQAHLYIKAHSFLTVHNIAI